MPSSGFSGRPDVCEQVQGPADDPYVGEAALQRDLGQISRLTGVPADYRVGPHDNDESTLKRTVAGCLALQRFDHWIPRGFDHLSGL